MAEFQGLLGFDVLRCCLLDEAWMYCDVDLGKHLLILKQLYHFLLKTFWLFVSFLFAAGLTYRHYLKYLF